MASAENASNDSAQSPAWSRKASPAATEAEAGGEGPGLAGEHERREAGERLEGLVEGRRSGQSGCWAGGRPPRGRRPRGITEACRLDTPRAAGVGWGRGGFRAGLVGAGEVIRSTRRCRSMAAVVVPVGVLAGHPPVVGDQPVHGLGQVDDLDRPSTWTHGPKKPSDSRTATAAGGRGRGSSAFIAVSRVLMTSTPSSATAATGDR